MSNNTLRGECPVPFYDASFFPPSGGYLDGRFCLPSSTPGGPTCCLPCPATQWIYDETSFNRVNVAAQWLAVLGLIATLSLIFSYVVLPVQYSRSHYLSTCLLVACVFIELGFIVPLGAKPSQCYNEITPNDMYSSTPCAWSGAFIVAGGIAADVWILVRALSMHLQICWDVVPGKKFFYWSQLFGWGLPAALFTATIAATGVSFRLGDMCHVNHNHSIADFWGWLMAVAAITCILQVATFSYCLNVYLRNLWADEDGVTSTERSGERTNYTGSTHTQTARALFRRLKRVVWLQWRGLLIVSIMLIDVIFFSVIFVELDKREYSVRSNPAAVEPWIICLLKTGGNKKECYAPAQHWLMNEATVSAVLILLSLIGVQSTVILWRSSIFTGWSDLLSSKFSSKEEFVSLDALPKEQRPWTSQSSQARSTPQPAKGSMFEMQRPAGFESSPTISTVQSPSESYQGSYQYPMGGPHGMVHHTQHPATNYSQPMYSHHDFAQHPQYPQAQEQYPQQHFIHAQDQYAQHPQYQQPAQDVYAQHPQQGYVPEQYAQQPQQPQQYPEQGWQQAAAGYNPREYFLNRSAQRSYQEHTLRGGSAAGSNVGSVQGGSVQSGSVQGYPLPNNWDPNQQYSHSSTPVQVQQPHTQSPPPPEELPQTTQHHVIYR